VNILNSGNPALDYVNDFEILNNKIYLTGLIAGTMDIDPGNNTVQLIGATDAFLISYNVNNGNLNWGFNLGGNSLEIGNFVSIINNKVYLNGTINSNNVDFNPGNGTNLLSPNGLSSPPYIAKYDTLGNYISAYIFDIAATGTYTNLTTNLEVINHGIGYRTNDVIKILGTELGGTSPENDMIFTIRMDNILSSDDDLVIDDKNAAFGLIYTNSAQGWKYTEQLAIPETILSDLKGNIVSSTTNNVVLDTDSATALFVGNVSGNLTGDVTGNLLGDLTGRVLTAAQPDITSLGTLTGLTVSTAINANLAGNVTGTLFGPVSGASVTAPSGLTLASTLNDIKIRSGKFGIIMSAFDDTGVQNQFAIQVIPGTAPGNRTSTYLYGDVSVVNQTGSNVNGASFKLPTYTNAGLAARSLSLLNYGELIYNSDTDKVQAYVAPGSWVDLH
jgi:hypothetical protein